MTARAMLPREAYLDEGWFREEGERVFGTSWCFAGTIHELTRPGDYISTSAGAYPIFVVRRSDGELGAYHNLCRHRGTQLLQEGTGNTGLHIVCGYHCWRYGLDGALRSVPRPRQFPDLQKDRLSLLPAKVDVFRGLVFVHPDLEAPDLEDVLGDFALHLGPYDVSELVELSRTERAMAANWKLFVENHIDSYHLWYAHRRSILGLAHDRQTNAYYNGHWSFFEPTKQAGVMVEFEKNLPTPKIVDDQRWYGSGVHLLFPNLGVVTGAKFLATLRAIPQTATTSRIEMRIFGRPRPDGFTDDDYRYYLDNGTSDGTDLTGEDINLCERVQISMASPKFRWGPLAEEYERSIGLFHKTISDRLGRTFAGISE
ncbi:MAG TPA: aromatic ring-hydroxylating dioxygenase subunit alpha [Allosphingosinicella sp.]|nr:aromatic ring-hydroxylating dioxygenase subunit alpha [Allosphingosinicella sp.]